MVKLSPEQSTIQDLAVSLISDSLQMQEKIKRLTKDVNDLINTSIVTYIPENVVLKTSTSADRAMVIYRHRRRRERVFGSDLFGDPAWDILLDLFISHQQGESVPIINVFQSVEVPETAGLRWLKLLEERGLIIRTINEGNELRSSVNLSVDAWIMLNNYLEAL